jgi:hypothetical protein
LVELSQLETPETLPATAIKTRAAPARLRQRTAPGRDRLLEMFIVVLSMASFFHSPYVSKTCAIQDVNVGENARPRVAPLGALSPRRKAPAPSAVRR